MKSCPKCESEDIHTQNDGINRCMDCDYSYDPSETKYCNIVEDRVCDDSCISFNKDGFSIIRVPYYDRSMAVPQWVWLAQKANRATVCKSGGFTIETHEEIKPPKEESWVVQSKER